MRVIIAGERQWNSHQMAENVIRRLTARYGSVTIVYGGECGIDHSFSLACWELGVEMDCVLLDYARAGDRRFQNREMVRRGAGLCLIFHRSELDEASKDLAGQATAAGMPVWLIDNEEGKPRRVR
jgi:YspA, cpYpsA-related SLOG family